MQTRRNTYTTSHGYQKVWTGTQYEYLHRVIMQLLLGRRLGPKEVVHHIDGNKLNNDPDNLELIESNGLHCHLHGPQRNRRPGAPNPVIKCACGCGLELERHDSAGRPRKYLVGHSRRKKQTARLPGEENPTIWCACGCGSQLLKYDKLNRPRRSLPGHLTGISRWGHVVPDAKT